MERELAGKTEVIEEILPQYHFVYHKSHLTCSGIEPRPRRWEAGAYRPSYGKPLKYTK
jgi:hypothetical protein